VARSAAPALRRRVENFALRWHARLDSDWSDHSLPWIVAGLAFAIFAGLALARHRELSTGTDLAVYTQAAWLIVHGHPARLTIVGFSLLDLHGSLLFYPLAQLARAPASAAQVLLVVQSAAMAYAVLPLWRIARRVAALRVGSAAVLVAAYVLYPATQNVNLADFHPVAVAVPLLASFCYRGLSGSRARYAFFGAAAVLLRADVALLVAGFGVLLACSGRRRVGCVTAVLAGLWFVLSLRVDWLGAGDGTFLTPGAFAAYGTGTGGVLGHWLAHPLDTLGHLVARRNFDMAVYLLVPLAFAPLMAVRYVAVTLPWLFLVAMADVPEAARRTELVAATIPFLLVATTIGLSRLGRPSVDRRAVPPRAVAALLAAAAVFFVAFADSSPYAHPWEWGGRDETDEARLAAVHLVHDNAPVAATTHLLVVLARRVEVYRYVPGEPLPADVDLVLADAADAADGVMVGPAATPSGFAFLQSDHGVSVYRRLFEPPMVGRN
jgi:uncharacterized membrane protein